MRGWNSGTHDVSQPLYALSDSDLLLRVLGIPLLTKPSYWLQGTNTGEKPGDGYTEGSSRDALASLRFPRAFPFSTP